MSESALKNIEQLVFTARDAGMPRDQLETFINAVYAPQAVQCKFHAAASLCDYDDGPSYVGYGGTRAQAKSHAVFAQVVIDDMQSLDGLKFLYLRKIQKRAEESMEDLRRKVLSHTPHVYKNNILTLPNKSFMIMGGFRSEGEIDGYLGQEYDGIVVEDATVLTKTKRVAIGGACRTSRTDWRPRMYESANPGGVGHQWFKKMYYDPWRSGQETETRFIHTTMGDNRFVDAGYTKYLDGLKGWLRKAWRDGDFEISAGQFFDNWSFDRLVMEPFRTPYGWTYWLAMDWGRVHWCIVYLLGYADGMIYVIDEHAERRWQVPQHAEAIRYMLARNMIEYKWLANFVASPDAFAAKDDTGISIADKFAKQDMPLTRANSDRIQGAAELLHRFGNDEGLPASLQIFDRCHKLISCIPELVHDPHRPEDVLKTDADDDTGEGGDDPYEALRYGVMERGNQRVWFGASPDAGWRG